MYYRLVNYITRITILNMFRRRVDSSSAAVTVVSTASVREGVSVNRSVDATEPEPEFVPCLTDRPVGLDLDEFLPVHYTY